MLNLQSFPPDLSLRDIISAYFVTHITDEKDLPIVADVYPMNIPAINFLSTPGLFRVINQDGTIQTIPQVSLVGQMSLSVITEFLLPGLMITVVFSPWGVYKLCGMDLQAILNLAIDPGDLFSHNELEKCRRAIFESGSIHEALQVTNSYFIRWLQLRNRDVRSMDGMAKLVNLHKGNIKIDWLVGQSNMSTKTFERHFQEKIGMTPKLFARVSRFSHAVKMLQGNTNIFSIIHDCGYVDQAHFIKECKAFCGKTPGLYADEDDDVSRFFFRHFVKE
jgi:AraC-like DNA-binding protein